ncbi:MAG: WD40 repeat domain-containing protein, partial [Gemmataceae bacterium]
AGDAIWWGALAALSVSLFAMGDWAPLRIFPWLVMHDADIQRMFLTFPCIYALAALVLVVARLVTPSWPRDVSVTAIILNLGGLAAGQAVTWVGWAGAAIFLAILLGRLGFALAGRVGLLSGEMLGAFAGGAMTCLIVAPLFSGILSPAEPGDARRKSWRGPLLVFGMTVASLVWFLSAEIPAGFALRYEGQSLASPAALFSPDGRLTVQIGSTGSARLWDVEAGQAGRDLEGADPVLGAFTADGKTLVARAMDETVRVWDVQTGRSLRRFEWGKGWQLAVSPDGALAVTASPSLPVMEMMSRSPPFRIRKALEGAEHNLIKIWDVNTGKEAGTLKGCTDLVASLAFSPDGRRVLSGSFDGKLRLWDVASREEIRTLERRTGWVTCVAYCPDGRHALAGYMDWSVRLWDLERGQELRCFEGHRGAVTCLAVSPDGRSFLSGGIDGTTRLWDLDSGAPRSVFRGTFLPVVGVSFAADGRLVASTILDGRLRVWGPKD